ncbi:MAG: pirin family protein [Maioricimonas sp. JB049]
MIERRPFESLGGADHGWLDARHHFSFASYHDAERTSWGALRVWNDDTIQPGTGFPPHPHADMEIVTYVLSGALEHRDSMGNGEVLRPGEFQRMSAGTGITHSEFNPSESEPVHLYQIWLYPERKGIEPSYEQKAFPAGQRQHRLQLVASPDAADGSLRIHQDARIFLANLKGNRAVRHELSSDRHAWLQVLRGNVRLNDTSLGTGDGAAVSDETTLTIAADDHAEVMLFDLP